MSKECHSERVQRAWESPTLFDVGDSNPRLKARWSDVKGK